MTKRLFFLSIAVLCYLVIKNWGMGPIVHAPGVLVNERPLQENLQPSGVVLEDYQLTRKARFEIRARILSTQSYRFSRFADLSPIDLALGWGVMSDQAILDRIDISQGNRWYYTKYEYPAPVSDTQIISNSSNMHMIPARKSIEKSLKKLRIGDIVTLSGYLVDVDNDSGDWWRTSMSRSDTGNGACEIVLVESLSVEKTD
jgi:hypothetical protein